MSRKLDDWIETYFKYTEETESPKIYHRWVAMSVIASVLRKKVWLNFGRLRIYPNLYVVLVSEPGVSRKSQAISYGLKLLNGVPDVVTSADSITREALLEDLQKCEIKTQLPNGEEFSHCSLSVISREFESFLGQKKENTKMVVLLTDLFDCEELPWKYRTKNQGTNVLPSIFFNLIGATTPESLASSLPSTAIGGGLTSRIVFVWSQGKNKKIPIPPDPLFKEELIHDLNIIARLTGSYEFSTSGRKFWIDWYNNFDEMSPTRLCRDRAFNGWYSRKPLYILKVAQVLAASVSNELLIHDITIDKAIKVIEEAEALMGNAFAAVGRSEITTDVELIESIVRQHGVIAEQKLRGIIWRDIDFAKFDNVINTVLPRGNVARIFVYNGKKGIWYKWIIKKGADNSGSQEV